MKHILAIILSLALLLAACAPQDRQADGIVVGGLYTLSGDLVPVTGGAAHGVRMAVEDFQQETGIEVRLIEEDDKSCADKTAPANKLVNIDEVQAIVGTTCSSMTLAVAPIAESAKVLLVSGVSTSTAVSDAGDYVFRTIPSDGEKSVKVAQELMACGYERVAIVSESDNDVSVTAIAGIKEALTGVDIVAEEAVLMDTHDFRTPLLKVDAAEPDAIVLSFTNSVQYAEFAQQRDELGLERVPVYVPIETIEHPQVIELGGESVEGIMFPAFAPPSGQQYDELKARYLAAYGQEMPAYVAESYDAAMLALKAIAGSDGTPEDAQRKMLEIGSGYEGVSGIVTFDENGDVHKPLVMKEIRGGEFVMAG